MLFLTVMIALTNTFLTCEGLILVRSKLFICFAAATIKSTKWESPSDSGQNPCRSGVSSMAQACQKYLDFLFSLPSKISV